MSRRHERRETLKRVRARAAKVAARTSHRLPEAGSESGSLQVNAPVVHREPEPTPVPTKRTPIPMPALRLPGTLLPLVTVAAIVVCVLLYFRSLQHGFAWMDYEYILGNSLLRSYLFAPDAFIQASFGEGGAAVYRPLTSLSYLVDYQTWGSSAVGYHATNLTLYLLSCLLVYVLGYQLYGRNLAAMAAFLLFAVHPSHAEPVLWVVGRADLLLGFLALLATISFMLYRSETGGPHQRRLALALTYLFTGAAILAKEVGVLLPATFLVWDLLFRRSVRLQWRQWMRFYLPLAVMVGGYLVARAAVLGAYPAAASMTVRAISMPSVAGQYLGYLLWPFAITPFHMVAPAGLQPAAQVALQSGGLALVLGACWWLRRRHPVLAFLGFSALLALLPAAAYLGRVPGLLGERMLYLPSLWATLAGGGVCAGVLRRLARRPLRVGASIVMVGLVAWLGVVSSARSSAWGDQVWLWRQVARQYPQVAAAHFQLGNAHFNRGEFAQAAGAYAAAISLDPRPAYFYNLGNVLLYLDRPREAIRAYRQAIARQPQYPQCYYNMGTAYLALGDRVRARQAYETAIAQAPRSDIAAAARTALQAIEKQPPPPG